MSGQLQLLDLTTRNRFITDIPLFDSSVKTFADSSPKTLEDVLGIIFPSHHDENRLRLARRTLGAVATELSDSDLETLLNKFEYLLDSWLDAFEMSIFDNKTLRQLLQEG